jgi:cyclin-dependent kinase 12/13
MDRRCSAPPHHHAAVERLHCRDVGEYRATGASLGEGTFGVVTEAVDAATGRRVVLKLIKSDDALNGFPVTALREVKILKTCPPHPSVVQLVEVVTSKPADQNRMLGDVFLVFEYVDGDLAGILTYPELARTHSQVRHYLRQLLEGVAHLHAHGVLHRDLKPANIMVSRGHEVKIADFGLSKRWRPELPTTPGIKLVTAWYRAPEVFLGDPQAGSAIDLWSVGIIFIELMTGSPPLQKAGDPEIMQALWALCGSPQPEQWPGVERLPNWHIARPRKAYSRNIRSKYGKYFSKTGLDLLEKLLVLNPAERITAAQALRHPYFEDDAATPPHRLPPIAIEKFHFATARSALEKFRKNKPLYVHGRPAVPDAPAAGQAPSSSSSSSSSSSLHSSLPASSSSSSSSSTFPSSSSLLPAALAAPRLVYDAGAGAGKRPRPTGTDGDAARLLHAGPAPEKRAHVDPISATKPAAASGMAIASSSSSSSSAGSSFARPLSLCPVPALAVPRLAPLARPVMTINRAMSAPPPPPPAPADASASNADGDDNSDDESLFLK